MSLTRTTSEMNRLHTKIKNLVAALKKKNTYLNEGQFSRHLKGLGFIRKAARGVTGYIFINRKKGVVIKTPYIVTSGHHHPPRAIITYTVRTEGRIKTCHGNHTYIYIQPLADVTCRARYRAHNILNKWMKLNHRPLWILLDLHDNNVAMYGKKAVLIDW